MARHKSFDRALASKEGYEPLQGHTAASMRWTTEGYWGRFEAVSIRKRGWEFSFRHLGGTMTVS